MEAAAEEVVDTVEAEDMEVEVTEAEGVVMEVGVLHVATMMVETIRQPDQFSVNICFFFDGEL
jgi:hypothetical protein